MADRHVEVIDLSDSYSLVDHRGLSDVVIDLDTDEAVAIDLDKDDSVVEIIQSSPATTSVTSIPQRNIVKKSQTLKLRHHNQTVDVKLVSFSEEDDSPTVKKANMGECPICYDPLGRRQIASTKCGHVYCMKCLERYLSLNKSCPTCRLSLRGKASYHPLYLSK